MAPLCTSKSGVVVSVVSTSGVVVSGMGTSGVVVSGVGTSGGLEVGLGLGTGSPRMSPRATPPVGLSVLPIPGFDNSELPEPPNVGANHFPRHLIG